ncbi:thiamine biosynthesis protein [Macrolepiota fuliginosa MF-IS2]|uniref:Thiamine biosynthesis protein n=1 Tax=Macrolepiota fuliginosa MF-IS2 TaxID=1400762 RepID=A0A9P5XLJ5_9AGAR|nr:thiamine biosynthesis protein [Macrolepiota fuliginosa MF-IS2]
MTPKTSSSPPVLTIAGSDCSGGAGIQADLKTFCAYKCYGASVITALTAQNTIAVADVFATPPQFIEKQVGMVLSDIDIKAIKTGMLFDAENTRAVVRSIEKHYSSSPSTKPPIICDPVCVSTSGHTLLHSDALDVLINELFPLATLITPNKSEAELLLSQRGFPMKINALEDMISAASRMILIFASHAVLVKGGHITATIEDVNRLAKANSQVRVLRHGLLGENMEILLASGEGRPDIDFNPELVVDVLQERGGETTLFVRPRVESTSTHGTGCTLSAAIACALAHGGTLVDAIDSATVYTHLGIETAEPIGQGHGPLNHLHSISKVLIPKPTRFNPYPFTKFLINSTAPTWKAYVEHDFVKQLGKGSLPRSAFLHFIIQDYHYLKYYARAYGLLAAKSSAFTEIDAATRTVLNILSEINTHKAFCHSFGVTQEELDSTPETTATTAYGAYLIDTGLQGDSTKLLMALLACLLGYGEVGLWLKKEATKEDSWVVYEGNSYKQWMDDYSGVGYQQAVWLGLGVIEARASGDPPSVLRLEEWKNVWERCTLLEKGFWDSAMANA